MSSAETIRITDLAHPDLSPRAREFIAATRDIAVDFTVEAVRQAAAAQLNGIALYDDPGLRERLGVLCAAIDEDTDLSPMGRLSLFGMLVRYLVQRCRLEQLYREHPEIDEVEIRAPLVITGLPRSGTTHLLNLISTDHRLRSLQYWESLEPIPRAGERVPPGAEDPRIQRCRDELAMREEILPLFNAMHDMHPFHIHEEIELLAMDFSTALFDTLAQLPRWTRLLPGSRPDAALRVPEAQPQGPAMAARPGALGVEVAAAHGAAGSADERLSRRAGGGHAPRSGFRHGVDDDDDRLCRADEPRSGAPRGDRRDYLPAHVAAPAHAGRNAAPAAAAAVDRRAVPRVHGR